MQKKIFVACALIAIGVIGRLVPHTPNATPLSAISVAAGRYVGRTWAIGIPLAAVAVSDIIIGWYDWRILLSVYASVTCIGLCSALAGAYRGYISTALAVIAAATVFFLITNAAVWAFSPWYDKSFSGLLYAYELGLPFFRSMLIGDLIYTPLLLSMFETRRALRGIPLLSWVRAPLRIMRPEAGIA